MLSTSCSFYSWKLDSKNSIPPVQQRDFKVLCCMYFCCFNSSSIYPTMTNAIPLKLQYVDVISFAQLCLFLWKKSLQNINKTREDQLKRNNRNKAYLIIQFWQGWQVSNSMCSTTLCLFLIHSSRARSLTGGSTIVFSKKNLNMSIYTYPNT